MHQDVILVEEEALHRHRNAQQQSGELYSWIRPSLLREAAHFLKVANVGVAKARGGTLANGGWLIFPY